MPTPKHTILFVDDEESILNSLRRLFKKEDYDVLTAMSGAEGLELMQKHEVSLLVSDQRMPAMIGAEFLARSKEVSPNTVRMMLTAYSDVEAATQAINEGGVYRFITKPWDDEELRAVVRAGIQRFAIENENRRLTAELTVKNQELEAFNQRLEEKVAERTDQLHLKVRELEGRDRIAQHMLTVHPLEETLEEVLSVAVEILQLDRAVIHMKDGDMFSAAAGIGASASGSREDGGQLQDLEISDALRQAFEKVEESREPTMEKDSSGHGSTFVVVPILRGNDLLGLLEADNHRARRPISEDELATIASFALQAAIAISDAQSHQDFDSWKQQLDCVLEDAAAVHHFAKSD